PRMSANPVTGLPSRHAWAVIRLTQVARAHALAGKASIAKRPCHYPRSAGRYRTRADSTARTSSARWGAAEVDRLSRRCCAFRVVVSRRQDASVRVPHRPTAQADHLDVALAC